MVKKAISLVVFLLFATFTEGKAFAAKGVVIFKKSECDYFIVETYMGYALLEWYGGNDPDQGDIVAGDFESYGFKDVYNLTADSELRVWVEEFWLSKDDVFEKYFEKCG